MQPTHAIWRTGVGHVKAGELVAGAHVPLENQGPVLRLGRRHWRKVLHVHQVEHVTYQLERIGHASTIYLVFNLEHQAAVLRLCWRQRPEPLWTTHRTQ